ncbi:MAG TPA: serine/threonine protein kinase [Polyangiaceae bacterium]|nr:serine/threonine protein kinase [Polyangiaceae bacterium]
MGSGDDAPDGHADELALDDTARSDEPSGRSISGNEATVEAAMAPLTGADVEVDDAGRTAGMTLGSSLTLDRPLGRGGMGSVWVARHETLDSEVAVKFIAKRLVDRGDTAAKRFEREARLAAKMKSPHAVKIFDHGRDEDGTPFIVMELLHGESLAERLERGPLSVNEAARVVQQIAEVLREAHDLGVVHRDIKPHNVFLTETGYDAFVKVLDFGVAKHVQVEEATVVTETGALVGTPFYMSPEQLLRASEPGRGSDRWALAVVAYQCLTGELPFRGETVAALGAALSKGRFVPASERRDDLPEALDDWFERALAPDEGDRFDDVGDMAQSFVEACGMPRASVPGTRESRPSASLRSSRPSKRSAAPAVGTLDGSSAGVETTRPNRRGLVVALAALLGLGLVYVALSEEDETTPATAPSSARGPEPASDPEPEPEQPEDAEPEDAEPEDAEPEDAEPEGAEPEHEHDPTTAARPAPPRPRQAVHAPLPTTKASAEPAAKSGKPDYCSHPTLAFERTPDGMLRYRKECQ